MPCLKIRIPCILLILSAFIFPFPVFSQSPEAETPSIYESSTIPDILRRPVRGEAPRYPRDRVIGELGQGTAPDGAWEYANKFLTAIVAGNGLFPDSAEKVPEKYTEALKEVEPLRFHIGGGRTEADGAVSFLVRFLGREQWMTGELYIAEDGEKWRLDDLILEEGRDIEEGKNIYQYDFTPYERFF